MREVLSVHEPLLVNTLGHSAGTVIFAIFLFLLLRDRAGARLRGSRLTITAAALAFLWNFASLLVIASPGASSGLAQWSILISSSALSLLPAVLLHLSLGAGYGWIRRAGYLLSAVSVSVHWSEIVMDAPENHHIALRITTIGFGALTLIAAGALLQGPGERKRLTSRLVGTMLLFLFSMSFVHFGAPQAHSWPGELVAHHAGIALALFVLLQDYRFLLVDAFVRFLANILFAAVFVFTLMSLVDVRRALAWASGYPFREGMVLVAACVLLLVFAFLRSTLSHLLVRLLFPRNNLEALLQQMRTHVSSSGDDASLLKWAAERTASLFDASLVSMDAAGSALFPIPVSDLPAGEREKLEAAGAEAVLPLRLTENEVRYILLGRRRGGRRYLSEDFAALSRIQAELVEQLDRHRQSEMRRLVSQAELRALQAQIHPHFLFNALNTLYGIIPREATGARKTVLNLADIFRYFLETDRQLIPLEEELRIVRAYLEIESLRLGSKLTTAIDASPDALRILIPILTVEPLVENAVKHGIAVKSEGGIVRVEAKMEEGGLRIRVSDTGAGFQSSTKAGVGMDNVEKRLRLCYGAGARLQVDSTPAGSRVEFLVPVRQTETILR